MRKIYRSILLLFGYFKNILKIYHLRLKYKGLHIDFSTKLARGVNIVCTKGSKISIQNSIISQGVHIKSDHGGEIVIDNSYIGHNSIIVALNSIKIKKNCQIAEMVVIRDHNHNYKIPNIPIKDQGFSVSPIIVNENVWIAAKATILKGVEIGQNTVIAAHAVVNKNVERNSVYGGLPAKIIKKL